MKNLAELVLDWAKADDAISHDGWDGGELEGWWDNAKEAMVSAAEEIASGKKSVVCSSEETVSNKNGCEPRGMFIRDSDNGEVLGVEFSIVKEPYAVGDRTIVAKIRLVGEDTGGSRHDALIPFELTLSDVGSIMSVLVGINSNAEISARLDPGLTRFLRVGHSDCKYVFEVSVNGDWPYFENLKTRVSPEDAYVMTKAIGNAMPRLAFGL